MQAFAISKIVRLENTWHLEAEKTLNSFRQKQKTFLKIILLPTKRLFMPHKRQQIVLLALKCDQRMLRISLIN